MKMIVYKVVSKVRDKIISFNSSSHLRENLLKGLGMDEDFVDTILFYELNQTTYPVISGSKLFAFETLESVKKYINSFTYTDSDWQVYEAEAEVDEVFNKEIKEPITSKRFIDLMGGFGDKYIRKFWSFFNPSTHFLGSIPHGTIFVDSIKLTKLVLEKEKLSVLYI